MGRPPSTAYGLNAATRILAFWWPLLGAIGILECRKAQAGLETLLRVLVERTLWSRGMLAAGRCTTAGIPPEAFYS